MEEKKNDVKTYKKNSKVYFSHIYKHSGINMLKGQKEPQVLSNW